MTKIKIPPVSIAVHEYNIHRHEYEITIIVPYDMPGAQKLVERYIDTAKAVGPATIARTEDHFD